MTPENRSREISRFERELAELKSSWSSFCESCCRNIPGAHAYLHDTAPLSVEAEWVMVGIDAEFYEEDFENVKTARFKDAIQGELGQRLGRDVGVKFKPIEFAPKSVAPCAESDEQPPKKGKSPREWCNEPVVQKTLAVFEGKISDLRL